MRAAGAASILFIEDDLQVRRASFDALSYAGHAVTLAKDGEEGLSLFEEGDYDIVFTDLGLPGLSGWKVVEAISQSPRDVRVVVMTGWPEGVIGQALDPVEVQGVLSKPFGTGRLLDLVGELMERQV